MSRRRDDGILTLAYDLADTGKFWNWLAVEWELRFQRHLPKARNVLDNEYVRKSLDERCAAARRAATHA